MTPEQLSNALHTRPSLRIKDDDNLRRAAVAAIIRPDGRLLFIRRAEHDGDPWSGHMAFPGGRKEPHDTDLVATAIRETHEEVGLDLRGAPMLGRLDDNVTPTNRPARLAISAYVFALPDPNPVLTPNPEVAATYWVSLTRFVNQEGRSTMNYPWKGQSITLPAVYLDDMHIWGLTLRFLDDLCDRVRAAGL